MSKIAADPAFQAAQALFQEGTPPDGGNWYGGAPEISFSFFDPTVTDYQRRTFPNGKNELHGNFVFGESFSSDGLYCDSILIGRFLKAFPGKEKALLKAFIEAAKPKLPGIKIEIQNWFKTQTWKALGDLVGYGAIDEWGDAKLLKLGIPKVSPSKARIQYGKIKMMVTVPVVLQATPKEAVTIRPLSDMSDPELNELIKEYESESPENFWMDGELGLSRPAAYAYYRKQWRALNPRAQVNLLESFQRGNRMNRMASRVSAAWSISELIPPMPERQDFQRALEELLARLMAAYQWNWSAHWQSVGTSSYGDHLLFERLYGAIPGEIDSLAEKMVVMFGEGSVNAIRRMQLVTEYMTRTEITPQADPIKLALFFEENIHNQIKEVLENWDETIHMSAGLRNFLEGVYDAHETAVYLIGQRIKDNRISSKVASRYLQAESMGDHQVDLLPLIKMAMEFDTPEALKQYLSEHPKADKSNHTVKKQPENSEGAPKDEGAKGSGSSRTIQPSGGGDPHRVIPGKGGNTIFMGNTTAKHISTHAQPGKGSVFSGKKGIPEAVAKAVAQIPESFFEGGGGAYEVKVPNCGYDLVQKSSDILKKYPNAKKIKTQKQEGVEMGEDGKPKKGPDGKVIPKFVSVTAYVIDEDKEAFSTDTMTVVARPANPQFLPEEAKADKDLSGAIENKKGFAMLTAFPGKSSDVPVASKWGDEYAIIVPNGGKGADEDIQKALSGKTASLRNKEALMPGTFRKQVIRLAYENPELRDQLLPMLQKEEPAKKREEPKTKDEEWDRRMEDLTFEYGRGASLRGTLIRLAHQNPEMRKQLLPLLTAPKKR